jgi:hypothetical protein
MVRKNGGVYPIVEDEYHIHVFRMNYDPSLLEYYNRSHKFIAERVDTRTLRKTMIFEKIEIQWMTLGEMKRRRREFRPFYRKILDRVIQESPQIREFIRSHN